MAITDDNSRIRPPGVESSFLIGATGVMIAAVMYELLIATHRTEFVEQLIGRLSEELPPLRLEIVFVTVLLCAINLRFWSIFVSGYLRTQSAGGADISPSPMKTRLLLLTAVKFTAIVVVFQILRNADRSVYNAVLFGFIGFIFFGLTVLLIRLSMKGDRGA